MHFFWNNFHDLMPPLIPRYVKNFFKKKTARLEIWANNQKQTTVLSKYLKPVFRRQKQVIWPNVSQGHIYRCLCLLENWPTNQATAATRSVASRNGSSCVTSLRAGVSRGLTFHDPPPLEIPLIDLSLDSGQDSCVITTSSDKAILQSSGHPQLFPPF